MAVHGVILLPGATSYNKRTLHMAGTSNVKTTSVTTIQIFMDKKQNLKAIKSHLKGHMINIILKLMIISFQIY